VVGVCFFFGVVFWVCGGFVLCCFLCKDLGGWWGGFGGGAKTLLCETL